MDRALRAALAVSPATQSHVGMVVHCEGALPTREQVVAHVGARLPLVPALRSIPSGLRWRVEAGLDLEAHVVERRIASGTASLEAAVGELIGAPLPEHAPAWQLHLLYGHTERGFALFYRVHHSLQDGGGMLHMLEALFSDDTETPSSAVCRGLAPTPRVSLRNMVTASGALLAGIRRGGTWASYPAGFSGERTHRWREVPVDRFRRLARANGATVNDVFLAALAHSLVHVARRLPSTPPAVPFLVPMNVRRPGEEDAPGNRFVTAFIAVSGGQCDTEERPALTPEATGVLKSARLREAMRRIIAHAPVAVITGVLKLSSRPDHAAATASNLVLRRRLDFQGAPVTRVWPVAWAPLGVPVAALLLTYGDTVTVCFATDPAMPGLDELPDHWRAVLESWEAHCPKAGQSGAGLTAESPGPTWRASRPHAGDCARTPKFGRIVQKL
jgi:diacylglycerol O-acyltransferase / wax synthase